MLNDIVKDEEKHVEILIVEDSPTQAMELAYILEQSAYTVHVAHNGDEAILLIDRYKPGIVISDVIMPGMDGYELCRRIKENTSLSNIYVILLTSLSEPKDVIKSLRCGADKFLTKPYNKELLLSSIEHLLHNTPMPDNVEEKNTIEVSYDGEKYPIHSSRIQILNLLISTYEAAVKKNAELIKTQEDLRILNRDLEERVKERTNALQAKNKELNIMSQQLWQASRLATMGELAASIAHELNNPLATVNLRVESLLSEVLPDAPQHRALEIIEQEVDRMSKLVANLLQFSRCRTREISTVDVCNEINNTLELIYYHLRKYNVNVLKEYSPDIPSIHADRQQLRQLFLNLFTNSSDAMPKGGTLTIRVSKQAAPAGELGPETGNRGTGAGRQFSKGDSFPESQTPNVEPFFQNLEPQPRTLEFKNSAFIDIEIIDTGIGIPPEIKSKIMEPFFTTKPEGKGTGLGLPICWRIVQEHAGVFKIESEAGKGTSVYIKLPVANGSSCFKPIENEGD